ncbi:MAG TPA: pyridoxamine 5'-phosphate oxidase family protein [Acidimicrobiia bacterium]|jgi:nitroimidazol reductase NimA-like FMN-containing flavoprotein (pyridoxamine 5'-phosphate oxidase superfamily)
MSMTISPRRIDELDAVTCRSLLASATLGRIGVTVDALPVILPVNYALDGDTIVIRTVQGTKLDAATRHQVAAFEVDDVNPETGEGWSVLVRGMTSEITDRTELAALARLGLESWGTGTAADHFVRVDLSLVTGRRVRIAD